MELKRVSFVIAEVSNATYIEILEFVSWHLL